MTTQYTVRKFRKKRDSDRLRHLHEARMRAWQKQVDREVQISRMLHEFRRGPLDIPSPEPRRPWWRRIFHNKKEDS